MAKKKMTLEEKLEEAIVKDIPYEVPNNWIWANSLNILDVAYGKNLSTKMLYVPSRSPLKTALISSGV